MRTTTLYDLRAELLVVDAVVAGAVERTSVKLILDTGAALTTLAPRVASSIGYTSADRLSWSVTRTATADEHGYVLRVRQLSVLGFKMARAAVNIADLGEDVDGLLGMSFLTHFNFEVRPAEHRIVAELIST